jgi:peptidoglycan/LPS O-acetylase OafA/YrhL
VVGWGNGLTLGYLMYRSALVPRRAAWLGLVGGPLIIASGTAVMFGGNHPSSTLHSLQAIVTIPEFLWELFLGVYCTIWVSGTMPRSCPGAPRSLPGGPVDARPRSGRNPARRREIRLPERP